MKHLYFWLFAFTYFISIAGNYTDISTNLPASEKTGMCFLNIDNDDDLEFVYSYIENTRQVTRIYQTNNGIIRTDQFFEVEDKFLTNITPVSFTNNDEIQFLAIEPFKNGDKTFYKFSVYEIITNDSDNVIGLEEIATSFSSIFFDKITYDVFDFDADGDLDIFFIGEGDPTVTEVLLNQGNYIFKNLPLQLPEYKDATIAHYDFTKDGFQDIYLAGQIGDNITGNLFKNESGKYLIPLNTKNINTPFPAVINGQVIIQQFNNNSSPDIYIRGEDHVIEYSGIYELTLNNDTLTSLNTLSKLPYFSNGIASIHDFDNDGLYDILTSGFFPNFNSKIKNRTQIFYQEQDEDTLIFLKEDLIALKSANVSVADINQDGRLEIITTGIGFDEDVKSEIPKTIFYNNNLTQNSRPSFKDPVNDVKIISDKNRIHISWNPAQDIETDEDVLFYEVHFSTKERKFTGNSSDPDGIRFFPSKGITQDTFLILNDIPIGNYIISVQAIDNGLLASKASVPKQIKITHELPKEFFDTFEIVQFRGENFENKFEIVDLDADGYKDFLVINKDKKLTYLVQKEINVFQKSPLFEEHVVNQTAHFELGDYSLDGYVDIWFLDGDSTDNELYIFDPQDSTLKSTEISNLESFLLLDIDNDLDLDIIAESKTQNGTIFYENNDGKFELITFSYDHFLRPLDIYDFNKDSYADFYFIEEIPDDTLNQNIYFGINSYNGKNKTNLFEKTKILTTEKFQVIDELDYGSDGDRDFLIEKKDGFAIFEKNTNWQITDFPFNDKFNKNKTQIRLADFDGDLKKEVWFFSIDSLVIYSKKGTTYIPTYKFETGIFNKDGNWGNTEGQKALQWIKIVDLNADGLNDLLAHVIINDKPQTYYFPNNFDKNVVSIEKPNTLSAKPSIGQATLEWEWEKDKVGNPKGEYLLEMKKVVFDGDDIDSTFLNFDGIHTIEGQTSTQFDKINYLGLTNSLEINNLLEGDYTWRIATKIENRFSDWSDWNTFKIHNFLRDDTLIPPVHHNNYTNLTSKFSKSADFDNDGDLDFLFIGHKNYVYINHENKKFETISLNNLPIYGYADVKIINYDHDDFPDLMISGIDTTWKTPSCAIYRNNQDKTFTKVADFPALAFGSMDQADIDNDGDLDYVVTGKNSEGKFENYLIRDKRLPFTEKPTFKEESFLIDNKSVNQVKAQFIDSDNDALIDLFCSVYNTEDNADNYFLIKKNQQLDSLSKNKTITDKTELKKIEESKKNTASYKFISTSFGDYNNDGFLDLILVGISPQDTIGIFGNEKKYYTNDIITSTSGKKLNWTLKLYENLGDDFEVRNSEIPIVPLGQNRIDNIEFWDIENDGDLDFFIQQAEHIVFVEKNDNGNFEQSSQMRLNGQFSFSVFGDFKSVDSSEIRDTRLDFITGSLNPKLQYTLEKNNVANKNFIPIEPESVTIEDPIDGSTEGVFNGTDATINWKSGSDSTNFGTEDASIQYNVSVYRNEKDTLLYNYKTHNPFLKLKNLEDGEYRCEVKSIDQGFEKSNLIARDTFTIWMDPIIIGNDKTCEDQLTTYTIEPDHQEYTWKFLKNDSTDKSQSVDEGLNSAELEWNTESTVEIIVTNTKYKTKTDTLSINVFRKPFADFSYGKEISLGAEILFTNLSGKYTDTYVWFVNEEISDSTSTNFTHTFSQSGEHNVSLKVSNQIGCEITKDTTINVKNNVIVNTSAFVTQNNDGKNDFLYIEHLERYSNNKITIFNQWGQELHVIENYNNNNWEDKMGDEKLPIGNYFLIIDVFVNDSETQTFKSTFSVLK